MQIDWGEAVGYLKRGADEDQFLLVPAFAIAVLLSVVCFRRKNTEALLEALRQALEFFGGIPAKVIFDNDR